MTSDENTSEFWLYGYGSLIWKPPPHFGNGYSSLASYRRPAISASQMWSKNNVLTYVAHHQTGESPVGYRVMSDDSGSEDHRGTPEAPGRVVTLIERSYWEQLTDHHDTAPDKVWGVAYRIHPEHVTEVKEYLDIREINGYSIHYTPFYPADGSAPIRTLVYIGTPDNEQFVGPQDPQKLAEHILRSRGPSGLNKDYLLGLDTALAELSSDSGDVHVSDLARRVRALEQNGNNQAEPLQASTPAPNFKQGSSTKEAEEIEKVGS